MASMNRRGFLLATAGIAGAAATLGLTGCGGDSPTLVTATSEAVARAEAARRRAGGSTVSAKLNPRPVTLDLGGLSLATWGYAETAPGPLIRAKAGDLVQVQVTNSLPAPTSVHWHGVALRNDMDGVPGITQPEIAAGATFTYEFTAPDPGTYFYHPHSGVQLDRGLYGVLIVDDRHEPGRYDAEWIVVLDDWIDGTGTTPDDVLVSLTGMAGMNHMQPGSAPGTTGGGHGGHGGHGGGSGAMPGMTGMPGMESNISPILGGAGDVTYPHYLLNGRTATAPVTLSAKPGQRVRIRLVNAASDTAFRVALAGHQLTVTHTDGFAVQPTTVDGIVIAMGERFDLEVTLADGVFPLVALAEGKKGQARAVVRTSGGAAARPDARPSGLDGRIAIANDLRAAAAVRLPDKKPDRTHRLTLAGTMMPYRWTINDKTYGQSSPLRVKQGERVRLTMENTSTMFHPMHLHGHTFAIAGGGARKDTVIVKPKQTVTVDFDATNPGQWMAHCHNIYHAETGMMINLAYVD